MIINPDVKLLQSEDVMENPIVMRPLETDLYKGLVDLAKTMAEINPKVMVEIGSYNGESLEIFRKYLPDTCKIFCIDPWEEGFDDNDVASSFTSMKTVETIFDKIFRKQKNVAKLKFYSDEVADIFANGSIDVLYIDGNHQYKAVKNDILTYMNKISNDGIIAGHDYYIDETSYIPVFFQVREENLFIRK